MRFAHIARQNLLISLLVLAAIGVVVLSAVSTAAIVGWLPPAHSVAHPLDESQPPSQGDSTPPESRFVPGPPVASAAEARAVRSAPGSAGDRTGGRPAAPPVAP